MSTLGRKSPSVVSNGSRLSVYSHASTTRSTRTLGGQHRGKTLKSQKLQWWEKPIIQSAFYTDLTSGAWHATFYTLFLAFWTAMWSIFDIYCLVEASPGSNHTGYYIFSFEFVYVGNHHVRNILMMSSLFSLVFSILIFINSCILLDALRLEKETGFKGWLYTMGAFTPWKIVAWVYHSIVNDIIFGYHIFMFITWFFINILDVLAVLVIYSLYIELTGVSKLENLAKIKMVTMSSRANSMYGSRPTSPGVRGSIPAGGVPYTGLSTGPPINNLPSNYSREGSYAQQDIPKRQSHF
ncbi:uncharacterized protein LOC111697753 [Eurytemora carolleeae]|uniref:uncharacterized protein LOC111697753 n=1 Tax=Eurytemora carolleeae TaxID=1294199 RepID=UPI000C780018|nr:uncharacterized protein LOC111697753 [Eurytemora carolleeae]XP_023323638.1 uncharacterized protein LOC111697753 [Eurytemora carolleeae]|eukprot:XP_023323631.1 uncharacterized protein LOC111697753 [Eurytemora affinis]